MKAYPFLSTFICTSKFGYRTIPIAGASSNHRGIDIVAIGNDVIVSCTDGIVEKVRYDSVYGHHIWIQNIDGTGALYAHLSEVYVYEGQSVKIKEKIGRQGNTGISTGSHLHFGISSSTEWENRDSGWFNPAVWWGIKDYNEIEDKTFDGSGYTTGKTMTSLSTNNVNASVVSEYDTTQGYLDSAIPSGEYYNVVNVKGAYSDYLYGRRYRVFITLDDGQAFDVSELRCKFEIIKSAYLEANQSIITIYNLSPENENKIIKQGQRVVIEAGYNGSQYGKIFSGNIIQPLRSKENGTDYLLTLVSMDNDRYIQYGLVTVAMVAEQSSRDAIDRLLNKSVIKTEAGLIADTNIKYPRGKIMFGNASKYLDQIAKTENAMQYSEDGKVNIVKPENVDRNNIISLGPDSGLIGTPIQTEYGVQCKCLLNPGLKISSLFNVDNKKISGYRYSPGSPVRALDKNGIYRIIKLTHTGDTRGEEWYTEMEALGQAGMLPGMMAGQDFYWG